MGGAKVQPAEHLKSRAAKAKIFYLAIETPKKAKVQCNWDLCKWWNKYICMFIYRCKRACGYMRKLPT